MLDVCGADLVVFDNDLTPAQERNLEKETGRIIVDRSEVILDIFASRARTYEARLQVELAQLQYFRNRLRKRWSHLERIEGGVGAGRGPGEKQIETDRRLIDRRIAELKKRLAEVEKRRERTVSARREQTDRLDRRLHERGQEHADERAHRFRRLRRRQALCHSRYADPPLAYCRIGAKSS